MLLTVKSHPFDGDDLRELIELDDRDHFFITGVSFWPQKEKLDEEFARAGTSPVEFGLFKPDLLEITRDEEGFVTWKVIDAKASKDIKVNCLETGPRDLIFKRSPLDSSSRPSLFLYPLSWTSVVPPLFPAFAIGCDMVASRWQFRKFRSLV
jgi:hypothetical protein